MLVLPSATPTDLPFAEAQTHVVQPGETLGDIAVTYDVSIEELVLANNLTDPDSIQADQVLLIPPIMTIPDGGGCVLAASFVADVTIPDNTEMAPNEIFTTTWRMRNDGTCEWNEDFRLVFLRGTRMGEIEWVPVPPAEAGDTVDISVVMVAPAEPGDYISVWQMRTPDGTLFGIQPYVQIIVSSAGAQAGEATPEQSAAASSSASAASSEVSIPVGTPFLFNVTTRAQEIFLAGQDMGNSQYGVSLVGDSITETGAFMRPLGDGSYVLGDYWYLQAAVDRFGPSFTRNRPAAQGGFRAWSLLGSTSACSGATLVACEYQTYRPSVAIIMIGTNDLTESDYGSVAGTLRQIVDVTIEHGAIPVLSTLPPNHGYDVTAYNGAVAQLATEYQIPLIDYHAAMLGLPNDGLGEDGIHPSLPPDGNTAYFDDGHLAYGYTMRNLTALQMLDTLLRRVMY